MTAFLKVNGDTIDIRTALQWQLIAGNQDFARETIKNAVIVQNAAKKGLKASQEDMQNVLDEMRYAMGLESAEAMNQWLKERALDLDAMQGFCEITALRNKMRAGVTEAQIQERYAEVQTKSETVELYAVFASSDDKAKEIKAQAEEGESFLQLARDNSNDADSARQGGFIGATSRGELAGEVEAAVFGGKAGDIIGPFKTEDGYAVYMIGKRHKPTLDEARFGLREAIFEESIHELAEKADVEQLILGLNVSPFAEDKEDDDEA